MKGYVYILKCRDGSYYTGSTKDVELRLKQHQNGEGSNYTKKRLPVKLVYYEEFDGAEQAFYKEKQIQGWSRAKKEALMKRDFDRLSLLSKNYTQYNNVPSTGSGTAPVVELVETTAHPVETTISEITADTVENAQPVPSTGSGTAPVVEPVETTAHPVKTTEYSDENKICPSENIDPVPSTGSGTAPQLVVSTGSTTVYSDENKIYPGENINPVPSTSSGTAPVVEPVETTVHPVKTTVHPVKTTISEITADTVENAEPVPSTGSGTAPQLVVSTGSTTVYSDENKIYPSENIDPVPSTSSGTALQSVVSTGSTT